MIFFKEAMIDKRPKLDCKKDAKENRSTKQDKAGGGLSGSSPRDRRSKFRFSDIERTVSRITEKNG